MFVSQRRMKQIGSLILLGILGKLYILLSHLRSEKQNILLINIHLLTVLAIYQTFVNSENVQTDTQIPSKPVNDQYKSHGNPSKQKQNNEEENETHYSAISDLQDARNRIRELEDKLRAVEAKVENRVPKNFPIVKFLNYKNRRRILITGGAGFVGSHLVDRLMLEGHEVIVLDNFFTGRKRNVEHWVGHENFELVHHDIVRPVYLEVDEIYHLASPASPPHYMYNPVKTLKTNTIGTINMLGNHCQILLF